MVLKLRSLVGFPPRQMFFQMTSDGQILNKKRSFSLELLVCGGYHDELQKVGRLCSERNIFFEGFLGHKLGSGVY